MRKCKKGRVFMTKKKNNWYSNHKKPVLICGIVVLVLLVVYLAGMLYYNDKFLNGTMVNGSDVGGMTLQKANDQLSKKVNGQSLKLIFNDGQSEVLQSAQLGVSYNKDNSLNQLMKNQNKWAWFIGFFKNEKNTFPLFFFILSLYSYNFLYCSSIAIIVLELFISN